MDRKNITINKSPIKITISGCGYVGKANAIILDELLGLNYNIIAYDVNPDVLKDLMLDELPLGIETTTDRDYAYKSDYIFLCLPTDSKDGRLDTSLLESEIDYIKSINPDCTIVIRSTCPVGFTELMILSHDMKIVFYPEFLREGSAVEDCRNPDRVIIGGDTRIDFLHEIFNNIIYCSPSEAEAIKLFSNTYLALRVAFFNELDNYCMLKNLDAKSIIEGVCSDKRIGNHYNNPSFGFGGYCLPKDSKELENQVEVNHVIKNINRSNRARKKIIADYIRYKYHGKKIGVYKLAMKKGSDNSRESSLADIVKMLDDVLIYDKDHETDINKLFECDVIVCNRYESELDAYSGEIFTRDIFNRD